MSKGQGVSGCCEAHHFGGGPKSHGSMFQIYWLDRVVRRSRHAYSRACGCRDTWAMRGARPSATCGFLGVDKEENLLVVEGSVPGAKADTS